MCAPWRCASFEHSNRKHQEMGSNSPHSTAKALRLIFLSVGCGFAMAMSAVAGAWMQSHFDQGRHASVALPPAGAAQQAEYIRESVGALAARLGEFQARLIALEGLGERVAEAAGVPYTDPEIQAGLEASQLESAAVMPQGTQPAWTAESAGRGLGQVA